MKTASPQNPASPGPSPTVSRLDRTQGLRIAAALDAMTKPDPRLTHPVNTPLSSISPPFKLIPGKARN